METLNESDPHSAVTRASDEEKSRLQAAGYMEIPAEAGGFSCGSCVYADSSTAECGQPDVMSPVSPEHGCCNLFWPASGEPIMSSEGNDE